MGKKKSHASPSDTAYKSEGRALKNKAIKIARYKAANPNDIQEKATVNYKRNKPLAYSYGAKNN